MNEKKEGSTENKWPHREKETKEVEESIRQEVTEE